MADVREVPVAPPPISGVCHERAAAAHVDAPRTFVRAAHERVGQGEAVGVVVDGPGDVIAVDDRTGRGDPDVAAGVALPPGERGGTGQCLERHRRSGVRGVREAGVRRRAGCRGRGGGHGGLGRGAARRGRGGGRGGRPRRWCGAGARLRRGPGPTNRVARPVVVVARGDVLGMEGCCHRLGGRRGRTCRAARHCAHGHACQQYAGAGDQCFGGREHAGGTCVSTVRAERAQVSHLGGSLTLWRGRPRQAPAMGKSR